MSIGLRLIGLLLVAAGTARAEVRTWTFEQSGTTLRAQVAGFTGDAVELRREDGKTVSVRIAYLTQSDRAYLTAERARQTKDAEFVSLDEFAPAPYKKCSVRGGVSGDILVRALPSAVEAILNARSQRTLQISNLTAQVESQKQAAQEAKAAASKATANGKRVPRRVMTAERANADIAAGDLETSRLKLAKLQKDYQASVDQAKAQMTVKMRNTGIVYKGLPVWECVQASE